MLGYDWHVHEEGGVWAEHWLDVFSCRVWPEYEWQPLPFALPGWRDSCRGGMGCLRLCMCVCERGREHQSLWEERGKEKGRGERKGERERKRDSRRMWREGAREKRRELQAARLNQRSLTAVSFLLQLSSPHFFSCCLAMTLMDTLISLST